MNAVVPLDAIIRLQEEMQLMPQADVPLEEYRGGGIYARKILIRKGVALVGEVHLTENMNIVSGDIEVLTEHGVKRLTGQGLVLISPPGTKRAGFALEDTVWISLHATDEKDTDAIRAQFIATGLDDPRLEALRSGLSKQEELPWLGS